MAYLTRNSLIFARSSINADGRQALIILIGLLMIGLGWLGIIYHLHSRENTIRQQAHRDVLNLSIAMEKQIERLLVSADQVMRFIADDLTNDPDTFDFQTWMRRSTSLDEVANQISFYNEKGELLDSRTPLAPGMPRFNVRDRAYFQALAVNPDLGLYIDRTMRGRLSGRNVFQTARRYNRLDGSFGGVIVTSINPGYLAQQFASLDIGRQGSVAVFGYDGYIRARFPHTEDMYERDVSTMRPGKSVFAYLKESTAGTYEVESGIDGVTRIFGYRAVGAYPLVVTVGQSLDEVLAPYRVERTRVIVAGLVATVLFLGVLVILLRMLRRDREQRFRVAAINRTLGDQKEAAQLAAEEARHANKLLKLAAQMAHVGHWRLDLPSNLVTWSDEVFCIFGLDPAAGVPSLGAAVEAYHPDDRDKVACFVSDSIREGSDYEFSARALRPDGSLREVVCRGCCEIGPGGHVTAMFGTILDVTEMRASERAVRESEARYRLLAENTRDMIFQVDLDRVWRYASPACHELLGYAPEELVGTKPFHIVHPNDRERVQCETMDLVKGRRDVIRSRRRYKHKEGYYVATEVSYRIFRDEQDRPLGYVACARDVNEQVAQEMALEEARRSAEQAGAEAERASRAKTEFLAAMSHEIRTPLNAVIGFTDLMVGSGRLEPGSQRQAELVRTSGVALLTIVNDILDFSKVEAGAIELVTEPFPVRALIENCVSIVRGSAASKRLQVKTVIDGRLPVSLLGDEARLRQVLLNLLNNAIKFTPAGSVTIMVRHDGTGPEGERLHFSVSDTGIGIPKAKQERLFHRFSQADESVHRTYGGTGLGLAICKQLVELMGGAIGLRSEEHQGSTFWLDVTLPSAKLQSVLAPVTQVPKPSRKGHLLLVEDVAINQELARAVLEIAGHTIEIVGDGTAAVQAVQTKTFDLVLMDVQMPNMDGVTATRLIRRLPGPLGRVPVIAMTANVLPDELRRFREAGMNDHIGKPFNRVELYATIDRWLSVDADAEARDATPDEFGFDWSIYEGLAHIMSPHRLSDALTTMLAELEGSFADPVRRPEDRARLRFEAHGMTSAAGTIGFIDLSAACRVLEACTEEHITQTGLDVFETLLETVRSQTKIAARLINQLIEQDQETVVKPKWGASPTSS